MAMVRGVQPEPGEGRQLLLQKGLGRVHQIQGQTGQSHGHAHQEQPGQAAQVVAVQGQAGHQAARPRARAAS